MDTHFHIFGDSGDVLEILLGTLKVTVSFVLEDVGVHQILFVLGEGSVGVSAQMHHQQTRFKHISKVGHPHGRQREPKQTLH